MRLLVSSAVVLFLGVMFVRAPVVADDERQPVALEGAPAVVTAPGPGFKRRTEFPKPGQWSIEWRKDGLVLQARVFPVRGTLDPSAVLVQAVATLASGRRFGGFGVPSRRAVDVWGRPAADGSFQVAVDGEPRKGRCRILLVTDQTWAFAWGLPGPESAAADRERIRAFVESLEPREPAFFALPFSVAERLAQVASPRQMKPVLTVRDLMATTGALEIAIGMRLSLSARTALLRMMATHLRSTPEVADVYRKTAALVAGASALPVTERHTAMRARGLELLEWFEGRAKGDEDAAKGVVRLTQFATRAAFEGGPLDSAVRSHREMAAFLASVADDRPVQPGTTASIEARWAQLAETDRQALRRAGATWAALRYAWDTARPLDRFRFRRAVVRALAADPAAPVPPADASPQVLYRHMHGNRDDGRSQALFARATALSGPAVAELIALLAVDAPGYHLGW